MNKILVSAIASFLVVTGLPAAALAVSCDINNTGPGSTNECTVDNNVNCEQTNNNDVVFDNNNDQNSQSGNTNNDGNTTGGDANSGNAGNDNSTDVNVEIDNSGCTENKPQTPAEGGKGSGTSTTTPQVKSATTTLPDTGSEMVIVGIATAFVLGTASAIATKKLVSDES